MATLEFWVHDHCVFWCSESGDLGGLGGSGTTTLPVSSSLSVLAWVSGMWISLWCILPSVIVDSSTVMVVGGVGIGDISVCYLFHLPDCDNCQHFPTYIQCFLIASHIFFSFSTCHLLSLSCTVCFSLLHLQVKIWSTVRTQNWSTWGKSSRSLKQNWKGNKNKGTEMQLPSNMSLFFYKSFLQNWNLFYLICDLYKSLLLITR